MKSPVILRVFKGNQLIEVKQFDQDQIVIGRNADVSIDLQADEVSPIHCLIELRDSGYYICDLGSTTGTFKNGQSVLDDSIQSGDEIVIGPFKISFFVGIPKPKAMPPGKMESTSAGVVPPPLPVEEEVVETPPSAPIQPPSLPGAHPQAVAPSIPTAAPVFETPKAAAVPQSAPRVEEVREEPKPRITTAPVVGPGKTETRYATHSAVASRKKKNKKTYAPPSEIKDLRDYLSPGKGSVVEVIVSWKERILSSYHYRAPGIVRMGPGSKYDINMPEGVCPIGWPLVEVGPETRVAATGDMTVEVLTKNGRKSVDELIRNGKGLRSGNSVTMKLDQEEIIFIALPYSDLQIYVRFVPQPPAIPIPPWFLSSSELTGMVMAMILVGLLALYVYATGPQIEEQEKQEEIVAQVVFDKPKPTPPPVKVVEERPEEPPAPTPAPPKPTPPPKKVQMADKQVDTQNKAKMPDPLKAARNSKAGAASEVAPKPNSKNKPKKFTSIKQGGSIKQGETAGANAQSANKDVNKVGMLAAFGGGGMRKNLDRAYSGAGDVIGMADKATGAAGFNQDRAGDDIGSKFKDTGAGGKGTATQGIAGVGTKGRGTGYGSGSGLGDKNSVAIEPGGVEEDFVGTIDREAVRRVIRAGLREIRGCYERELNKKSKAERLEGKVIIEWTIADQGRALNAKVKSSTLGNRAVENCVRDRLATWKFPDPPPGTVAEVNYPFYFRAEN